MLGAAEKSKNSLSFFGEMKWTSGSKMKRMSIALSKRARGLPDEKMIESANELSRYWPLYKEYGLASLLSTHPDLIWPLQTKIDGSFPLDTFTFAGMFTRHEYLMSKIEESAIEVCQKWNDKNGGYKNLGKREHVQVSFDLVSVVWLTLEGDVRISSIIIQVSCFLANEEKMNNPDAHMTVNDCQVNLKMKKSVGSRTNETSSCGIQISIPALREFVICKTMRSAVNLANDFLANLKLSEPNSTCWRTVPEGREKEEFAREFINSVFTKKRRIIVEDKGPKTKQRSV